MSMRLVVGYSLLTLLVLAAAIVLIVAARRRRAAHALRWARRSRR